MSGTQQLVGAAGVGLIAVNLWTGKQRQQLAPVWSGSKDLSGAHTVAKEVGVELVAVTGLVLVAGTSRAAAGSCLAILAALWLVWLMARPGGGSGGTGRTWTGPLPGLGPLLPAPSGKGKTNTTLPRNTIPLPGMP